LRATPKPTGRSRCGGGRIDHVGLQAASTEAFARIRERLVRTGAGDGTVTADGDRDGLYLSIVEFDSYKTAMRTRIGQRSASTQAG
jgi:hypothetical protein